MDHAILLYKSSWDADTIHRCRSKLLMKKKILNFTKEMINMIIKFFKLLDTALVCADLVRSNYKNASAAGALIRAAVER